MSLLQYFSCHWYYRALTHNVIRFVSTVCEVKVNRIENPKKESFSTFLLWFLFWLQRFLFLSHLRLYSVFLHLPKAWLFLVYHDTCYKILPAWWQRKVTCAADPFPTLTRMLEVAQRVYFVMCGPKGSQCTPKLSKCSKMVIRRNCNKFI